jgi:ADP-ribose pyrophosphatase YjhB (NUDIX family)
VVDQSPFSHCHFCGVAYAEQGWPRRCANCGQLAYRNPTPVAVALTPVTGGDEPGLLLVVRALAPLGPALPGGFVDSADRDWQFACAREVREETGLEVQVQRLWDARSTPGGGQILLFALTTAVSAAAAASAAASDETSGVTVLAGPGALLDEIVFDLHREAATAWLAAGRPLS